MATPSLPPAQVRGVSWGLQRRLEEPHLGGQGCAPQQCPWGLTTSDGYVLSLVSRLLFLKLSSSLMAESSQHTWGQGMSRAQLTQLREGLAREAPRRRRLELRDGWGGRACRSEVRRGLVSSRCWALGGWRTEVGPRARQEAGRLGRGQCNQPCALSGCGHSTGGLGI